MTDAVDVLANAIRETSRDVAAGRLAESYMQYLAVSGYIVVPYKPTEPMLVAARDWSAAKYGKPVGNDGAAGCYHSMITAHI